MDVPTTTQHVTGSKTCQSYLPTKSTSTTTDTVNAKFSSKSGHVQSASCLITPGEIRNTERQFDTCIVVCRPSTAHLISTHRKEIKEWHRKRKKKLMDRRRTSMTRWVFLASSNLRFEGETDCHLNAMFLFSAQKKKQLTVDFHSLKIRRSDTGGAFFFCVVPGGVMRDFLINFKTGDFYQKLKGLMQSIPGNTGMSYYQFHWMTTKKKINDTNIYDWRDNELIQTATSYSLESMMHQIMDQLAATGDILSEGEETCWQFYPSLVFTKILASHQKPHLDFPKAEFMRKGRVPFILQLPLC
jgi:hypothetical protein